MNTSKHLKAELDNLVFALFYVARNTKNNTDRTDGKNDFAEPGTGNPAELLGVMLFNFFYLSFQSIFMNKQKKKQQNTTTI